MDTATLNRLRDYDGYLMGVHRSYNKAMAEEQAMYLYRTRDNPIGEIEHDDEAKAYVVKYKDEDRKVWHRIFFYPD